MNIATYIFVSTIAAAAFFYITPIALIAIPILKLLVSTIPIAAAITSMVHFKLFKPYNWGESDNIKMTNVIKTNLKENNDGHTLGDDGYFARGLQWIASVKTKKAEKKAEEAMNNIEGLIPQSP